LEPNAEIGCPAAGLLRLLRAAQYDNPLTHGIHFRSSSRNFLTQISARHDQQVFFLRFLPFKRQYDNIG
jgi:hypothetical protein